MSAVRGALADADPGSAWEWYREKRNAEGWGPTGTPRAAAQESPRLEGGTDGEEATDARRCPRCGALPGVPCRSGGGNALGKKRPHGARREAVPATGQDVDPTTEQGDHQ